jgi:hypothetical protein
MPTVFFPAYVVNSYSLIPVQAVVAIPKIIDIQQVSEARKLKVGVSTGMTGYER